MAKKKLTATQRKARKKAAYYKREYYKTYRAIEYMRSLSNLPPVKMPAHINKKTLETIRKKYKQYRKEAERQGASLPSKAEMARAELEYYRSAWRQSQEIAPEGVDIAMQSIDAIRDKINALMSVNEKRQKVSTAQPKEEQGKTPENFNKNVRPKFEEVKNNLLGIIDQAVATLGVEKAADVLADSTFMQRVENLEEKYTFELLEDATDDSDILALIDASIEDALSDVE